MTDITEDDRKRAQQFWLEGVKSCHGQQGWISALALALAEMRERAEVRWKDTFKRTDMQLGHALDRLDEAVVCIAELKGERDRQYDYNVGQIAKQAELEAELVRLQSERDEYAQRWADACDREQRALGAGTAWPPTGTKGAVGQ